jgi:hypothetical protein
MSRCNLIPSSRTRFRLFVPDAGLPAPLAGTHGELQV